MKYKSNTLGSLHVQIFILPSAFFQYTSTLLAIKFNRKTDEKAIFSPLSADLFSTALVETV